VLSSNTKQQQHNSCCASSKVCDRLLYVYRHEETSEKGLQCLWTKAALMLDWGSSTFVITRAGIVGISNSVNTKYFIYVATTTQQHNEYSRKLNVCCIVYCYHIRSQMNWKLMYWEDDIKSTRMKWVKLASTRSIVWCFVNITIFWVP